MFHQTALDPTVVSCDNIIQVINSVCFFKHYVFEGFTFKNNDLNILFGNSFSFKVISTCRFVLTCSSVSAVSPHGSSCDAGRSGYLVIQRSDRGQH